MPTVILYTAASLDGFIARTDGSVDWLFTGDDYGYAAFLQTIGALVMGSKTYEQVLSFGDWPYSGKQTYVFTRRDLKTELGDVVFVSGKPQSVLPEIKAKGFRRIWLVGGGELTTSFLRHCLVDEYIVSIHPILLGDGIPLFYPPVPEEELTLVSSKQYPSGLLQAHYRRKTN
jgi:dihydrofolate reductase